MTKPKTDDRLATEPCSCMCCKRCQRFVTGPEAGRCIYGGPFAGYSMDNPGEYAYPKSTDVVVLHGEGSDVRRQISEDVPVQASAE
jgi:hypothetical protein